MKKIVLIIAILTAYSVVIAQNDDDALRFSMDKFSGTARSISLSGAMGALGGDFSSIAINPAGMAVYRSSEFTFTPGLNYNKTTSEYYGMSSSVDKFSLPLLQIGYVGTYMPMREVTSGVVSSHFSIGYNRTNTFTKSYYLEGNEVYHSLLDRFTYDANNYPWSNFYCGLANNVGLIYDFLDNPDVFYNVLEYEGPDGIGFGPQKGVRQRRAINERGNAGEFHFGGGVNISNKVMLGATLGINSLNYRHSLQHREDVIGRNYKEEYFKWNNNFVGLDNFTFEETLYTTGIGINLKIGAIYKPFNSLRIGASLQTPVFYSINEELETQSEVNYFKINNNKPENTVREPRYKEFGTISYNFRTPLKATGSLAYIFGSIGLISVDYEYIDYSTMLFVPKETGIDDKDYFNQINSAISKTFRNPHNIRVGAEVRPTELLTLRGGFGYYQSPYLEKFPNSDNRHLTFSGGFGYKFNNMFVDVAYMIRQQQNLYSPYNLDDVPYIVEKPQSADISSNNHLIAVTLGWRF